MNEELTKEYIKYWLEDYYPATILLDRYSGTYSGGLYVAFPLAYYDIPTDGPEGDDGECMLFWQENKIPYGVGNTPDNAFNNLKVKMTLMQ